MTVSLAGARIHFTEVDARTSPFTGNVGLNVHDDPAAVLGRREKLARDLGREIVWMNQTHSTKVVSLGAYESGESSAGEETPWPPTIVDCDGLVIDARRWANAPGVAVQTADCLPVVLTCHDGQIISAVHAGRRGLLGGILTNAVRSMRVLSSAPISALIGPAICGNCYEVPDAMWRESEETLHGIGASTSWGTLSLNLPGAAQQQLEELGVSVLCDERCTLEDASLFSYRRDPSCGRQALIILPA